MANEILISYITGKITLTANIYYDDDETITEREADISLTEEPASSGVYKGSPTTILPNDVINIYDGGILIAANQYLSNTGKPDLDSISVTEPSGRASTFREMIVQLYSRFFNKVTLDNNHLKVYKNNNSVNTTQNVSDSGTTQTVEKA